MKSKLAPLILIIAIVISIFFIFRLYSERQSLISAVQQLNSDKDSLREENTALKRKISDYKSQNESLSSRLEEVTRTLNNLQAERDNFRGQVDSLQEENQNLRQQLSQLRSRISQVSLGTAKKKISTAGVSGAASDKYWQDVLRERAELKVKVKDLKKKVEGLLLKISKLKEEKSQVTVELSGLKKEKADWQSKLDFNNRTIDLLTKQLIRERERSRKVLEEFDSLRRDNINLRSSLNLANAQKEKLLARLKEIDDKKDILEEKVKNIEMILKQKSMELESLQDQLSSALSSAKSTSEEKSVELPPIVVSPEGSFVSSSASESTSQDWLSKSPSLEGKIIAVNQKDKFVIIDLGKDAGLKVGDRLEVKRAGKKIASLAVIETRKDISACDIIAGSNIKEGDQAIRVR
ncbi:MAG: hypothetical protein J7J25_00270 [Candidatus Omnitrophica bacterium]|nr:hypothetical protein [Candidatus Omnitrophota bacterium]